MDYFYKENTVVGKLILFLIFSLIMILFLIEVISNIKDFFKKKKYDK